MKKIVALLLAAVMLIPVVGAAGEVETTAVSYVLMEESTGEVLLEQNSHEARPIASVTKIMTLLLIMEAFDDGLLTLDTEMTASANACAMGGSQIYLEEGETMRCEDLLKSVIISSANDAAVVFAEYIAGTENAFVERMNLKAAELGMADTVFENCTGLPENGHVSSAFDVAIMSRALIAHDLVGNYTTIWMDTVRNGEFGLANTNKLIKSYKGITGLKTGFTNDAMFCVSATAERDGMSLISVVLGAQTGADRFKTAASLLDWGYANYALYTVGEKEVPAEVPVDMGIKETVRIAVSGGDGILIEKNRLSTLEITAEMCDYVCAPVVSGQILGQLTVTSEGEEIAVLDIIAAEDVLRLSFGNIYLMSLRTLFAGGK